MSSVQTPISASTATEPHSVPAGSRSCSGWTRERLIIALLFAAAGILATRGAWEDILHIAQRDEEASHIWLVPFLAGWLVWIRRASVAVTHPTSSLFGPLLVLIGWAISHYGFYSAKQSPWHAGAVLVVIGCITSVLGARLLVKLWPAILVLAFLVPVPGMVRQKISIPLESVTAAATAHILSFAGAPIDRSANVITINGQPVTVAEACNGLRMIFPLFLIVYVFCFTLPFKPAARWLLLIGSPLVAVVCNVVRLLPTVCLYGYASASTASNFHDVSGWLMVPIAFLVLMLIKKLIESFGFEMLDSPAPSQQAKAAVEIADQTRASTAATLLGGHPMKEPA